MILFLWAAFYGKDLHEPTYSFKCPYIVYSNGIAGINKASLEQCDRFAAVELGFSFCKNNQTENISQYTIWGRPIHIIIG